MSSQRDHGTLRNQEAQPCTWRNVPVSSDKANAAGREGAEAFL